MTRGALTGLLSFPRLIAFRNADAGWATPARVVVVSDHHVVNGTTAQFYASQNGLPLEIRPCRTVPHAAAADFRGVDFVIAKSDAAWVKPKLDGCFYNSTGREDYAALLRALDEAFVLARSETLPDGSALLPIASRVPTHPWRGPSSRC